MEGTFVKANSVEFRLDRVFYEAAGVDESILDQAFLGLFLDIMGEFDFGLEVWNGRYVREIRVASKFGWEESFHPESARICMRKVTLLQSPHR